jgi:DNA-binding winged helix-turn-helix (wHTH) protein/TolB-like protein
LIFMRKAFILGTPSKSFKNLLNYFLKPLKAVMKAPTRLFYEFGQFRLDVEKHRLVREGEIMSLTPKAVETLRVLVERAGVLVERDELKDFVWPDSTVEPGNLDVTISKLRKELKEKERGQKFIETVPRLGYKFVADVRQVVEDVPALIVDKQTFGRVVVDEEISLSRRSSDSALRLLPSAHRRMPVVLVTTVALILGIAGFAYFSHGTTGRAVARIRNIRSIAVLPFRSLSANEADGNYLGSGIADALITRLGSLDQLSVRPTSAVLRFDNPKQDSLAAARALGVDAVLEGSYQHEGDRLRVTVQLVSARDGGQIWASTINEEFKDILAVQDQISQDVARALVSNLSDAEQRLLVKRPTASLEAYQAYLKGRYFWNKRTEEDLKRSIDYFQKAIELDPNYALAYAGAADSYALLVWNLGSCES